LRKQLYITLLFILSGITLFAQSSKEEDKLTRILFVFDGSQSMYGRWESGAKIDVAQKLMTQILDSLQSLDSKSFQLALRVYGHQKPVPPQDCNDTKLEVSFKFNNIPGIKQALREISPKGTTPIARSLLRAAQDFTPCGSCRNIIILITDGVEACDEDPCAAALLLQKKGIALKPFVIGIGIDKSFRETLECVGTYYDASDEKTFEDVLGVVISQALNNTSAQVNLLNHEGAPIETNIPITFYDEVSGQVKKQMVHTLNFKGNPDTIYLDPLVNYALTIHSLPEVHLNNISVKAGQHNILKTNVPRGTLSFKMGSTRHGYENLMCIVRKHGANDIINAQSFSSTQQYLAGMYDIEILTLPRHKQQNLEIKGGENTNIGIPHPGKVNISSTAPGFGAILLQEGDKQIWLMDLDPTATRHSLFMQPGTYTVVFRPASSQNTEYSVSQSFSITSGTTTIVKLN
jgi:Ca-activated chloride channel family protein